MKIFKKASSTETWIPAQFLIDLTGWPGERMRQAREQRLITYRAKNDTKGYEYLLESLNEKFIIKCNCNGRNKRKRFWAIPSTDGVHSGKFIALASNNACFETLGYNYSDGPPTVMSNEEPVAESVVDSIVVVGPYSKNSSGETIAVAERVEDSKGSGIYPNPNPGKFTITDPILSLKNTQIEVFSLLGKKLNTKIVYLGASGTIDLGAIPNGVYFLRLSNGSQNRSYRIVVKR